MKLNWLRAANQLSWIYLMKPNPATKWINQSGSHSMKWISWLIIWHYVVWWSWIESNLNKIWINPQFNLSSVPPIEFFSFAALLFIQPLIQQFSSKEVFKLIHKVGTMNGLIQRIVHTSIALWGKSFVELFNFIIGSIIYLWIRKIRS